MSTGRDAIRYGKPLVLSFTLLALVATLPILFGGTKSGGAPTTVTTIQDGSNSSNGVTFSRPFTTVPSSAPTNVAPPVVPNSATVCTSSMLTAQVTGVGPHTNNPSTGQLIVSLNSSTECSIMGFPTISISDSAGAVATQITNGGTAGASLIPSSVTLGTSVLASFMIQYDQNLQCPTANSMSVQIPGGSSPINVDLNGNLVEICGAVNVTPIIQGNNVFEYL